MVDLLLLALLWLITASVIVLAFFIPGLPGIAVAIVGVAMAWKSFLLTIRRLP